MSSLHQAVVDGQDAVALRSGGADLEAVLVPEAGMVCTSLRHEGAELLGQRDGLEGYVRRGATMGIPLLHPWANRLAAEAFAVAGQEVRLPAGSPLVHREEHGLAIHGLLAASPHWRLVPANGGSGAPAVAAELDFGAHPELIEAFPFPHRLRLDVALDGPTLTVRTTLTPTGDRPVPVAFGFHPYLRLPGVPREQWRVELPPMRRLQLDGRGIPTGAWVAVPAESRPLGVRTFDDAYAGLRAGSGFRVSGRGRRISVRFAQGYPFAQVYAPADDAVICFEPMTAPTNALVSGDGLRLVAAGSRHVATFSVTVA
jgi:aldose 1-epimerase